MSARRKKTTPQPSEDPDLVDATTRANNRTMIMVALIGVVSAAVGSGVTVAVQQWRDAKDAEPPSVTITNKQAIGPEVGGPITVTGDVKNLGPGQTIWASFKLANAKGLYPAAGPCPVNKDGHWACTSFYLGKPGGDWGTQFQVFAAVVEDEDVGELLAKFEEHAKGAYTAIPGLEQPKAVAFDEVDTTKRQGSGSEAG